jgi:hypothetical protein
MKSHGQDVVLGVQVQVKLPCAYALYMILVQLPGFARVRPPDAPLITHPHHTQTQPNKEQQKKIKKIYNNISFFIFLKLKKKFQKSF